MKLETFKWIYQRVSTPFILILFYWLAYQSYQIQDLSYTIIIDFFKSYLNFFFFIAFILLSLFHTAIEVFHAVNDYFSETRNEKIVVNIIKIFYMIIFLSILYSAINFVY